MIEWEWSDEQSEALWLLAPISDKDNPGKFLFGKQYADYYRIIYGGSAFGGKSTLISAWLDMMCRNFEATRYYLGRDTLKDIKESVLLTYFDWCKKTGSQFRYNEQKSKITYRNGSEIFLLETFNYPSDPNFDRFGSREYTAGAIEEGVTTTKRASDLLLSRTRFKHIEFGLKPKQLITLNPGEGWIKDDIVMPTMEAGRAKKPFDKFIKATLRSNPDKVAAEAYEKTLTETNNSYDLARLLEGDWNARPKSGAEYLKEFSQLRHVLPTVYDPALALHVSFDENVHPYITALIFQIQKVADVRHVVQIAEICQPPPNNSRKKVCEAICAKYRFHNGGMFIYGDATSKKSDTAKEYGENFFTDIMFHMKQFHPVLRVPPANPPVASRAGFINIILEKTFRQLRFIVDPSCKLSISDYCFALEDSDGGILKKRVTNPETGIQYEKHGHHVDAMCYFYCEAFLSEFNYYLTGGVEPNYLVGSDRREKFNR